MQAIEIGPIVLRENILNVDNVIHYINLPLYVLHISPLYEESGLFLIKT